MPTTPLGLDCSKNRRNIGLENCIVEYGQKTGHIQVPKGWSLDLSAVTFNKAYVNTQVQQGIFRVVANLFEVKTDTPAAKTETSSLGKNAVVMRSMPVVTSISKKGYEWHSSIYTDSGQDKYDVIEIFETGILRAAVSVDGKTLTGLSAGMYEIGTFEDNNGTNSAQTQIIYQLDDILQYNTLAVPLTGLDFNPNSEISNIVDAQLSTIAIPAVASVTDNKVYFPIVWARNPQKTIAGFAAANFKLKVAGVDNAIVGTVTRGIDGRWAVTPTATLANGDLVEVYMYDTTATPPVAVAKLGTTNPKFYDGTTGVLMAGT